MAKLLTLLEQHLDGQPPTVVIQAIIWWETALALVKLQECGQGVHLPVKVARMLSVLFCNLNVHNINTIIIRTKLISSVRIQWNTMINSFSRKGGCLKN